VMCGCLFLNSFFSSYTFSLTVIIATGNQLDGSFHCGSLPDAIVLLG